jgi:hypothetical protein
MGERPLLVDDILLTHFTASDDVDVSRRFCTHVFADPGSLIE